MSCGRDVSRTGISPTCYAAAPFCEENDTHTASTRNSNTEALATLRKSYCYVPHHLQGKARQLTDLSRTATNLEIRTQHPADDEPEVGLGSTRSQPTINCTSHDLSRRLKTSPGASVTIMLSHKVVHMDCRAAMMLAPLGHTAHVHDMCAELRRNDV